SWALLAEEERRALARLSVFRGGFQREAAKEVAGADLRLLTALVDKSLLRHREGRYEMLEVMRQYAVEKGREMGQAEAWRERHGLYYLRFLEERRERLKGGQAKEALEEIRRELDNVREGWQWAVERGRWAELGRAAESLGLFCEMQSLFYEGEEAFRRAVEVLQEVAERSRDQENTLGRILAYHAWFYERLSRYWEARELFVESLRLLRRLGDVEGMAFATAHLGHVLYRLGEYGPARQLLEESLEISRQSGNLWHMARALNNLGIVASTLGEHEEARRFYEDSLALFRRIGNRLGIANTLNNLGVVNSVLGDYAEAARLYRESLEIFQELGGRRGSAFALVNLGYISGKQDEYAEAERLSLEGLALFREIGDRWGMANTLSNLGRIACTLGKYPASWGYFRQAMETALELRARPLMLEMLTGTARLLFREGKPTEALEVLAVVLRHPVLDEDTRQEAEHLLADLRTVLPPEAVAAALEQGGEREITAVAESLLHR
ncbi:MAG: tetratricopeptide repeat protein, partial [Chloroflexia bacterium]